MKKSYFAVGTNLYEDTPREAKLIAKAIHWLISNKNSNGIWGGEDNLDRFICTNHAVMALFSVGFSSESPQLSKPLEYLVKQNEDEQVSFFWRAGTLLNIKKYNDLVCNDIEYIWKYTGRTGAHKDYPIPFFLLKLVKYLDVNKKFSFSMKDVLDWILKYWNDKECWYGKTSITSMALCLIYDMSFKNKEKVLRISVNYIKSSFIPIGINRGKYSSNIVDDCFTLYNFCESEYFYSIDKELKEQLKRVFNNIIHSFSSDGYIVSKPPFGGNIDTFIYPTAVAIRAVLSYLTKTNQYILNQIASELLNDNNMASKLEVSNEVKVIVKKIKREFKGKKIAFIMMAFRNKKPHNELKDTIKKVLQEKNIIGLRTDDKAYSDDTFTNILAYIYACDFGIAVFERIARDYFNPNVSLEVGYMLGLNKPVCLLKDQTLRNLQTDLLGKLYKSFNTNNIKNTVPKELNKWLMDKGFA
jgi:nucleoside 2-deoxyribosyltransferase